jgi:hypothetical protein
MYVYFYEDQSDQNITYDLEYLYRAFFSFTVDLYGIVHLSYADV